MEAKSALAEEPVELLRLSAQIRDSWVSGRFWFNYASRTCLDIDDIYWHALHDQAEGDGVELLDEITRADIELLVRLKMEQRKAYEEECAIRF